MGRKAGPLYTVEEANHVLPLVKSIVCDVVDDFGVLRSVGRERRALEVEAAAQGRELPALCGLREEIARLSERIEGYLRELSDLAIEVRDLELGLVDFPAIWRGSPAFLSWRLGERSVGHWHPADTGFNDREPLPDEATANSAG